MPRPGLLATGIGCPSPLSLTAGQQGLGARAELATRGLSLLEPLRPSKEQGPSRPQAGQRLLRSPCPWETGSLETLAVHDLSAPPWAASSGPSKQGPPHLSRERGIPGPSSPAPPSQPGLCTCAPGPPQAQVR